jgi:hypothetical protein
MLQKEIVTRGEKMRQNGTKLGRNIFLKILKLKIKYQTQDRVGPIS